MASSVIYQPSAPPLPEVPEWIKTQFPRPPAIEPDPWTWICACLEHYPISKPRCLKCGRYRRLQPESHAQFQVRGAKFRQMAAQVAEIKADPSIYGKTARVFLEKRLKMMMPVAFRQYFDYKGWREWNTWKADCGVVRDVLQSGRDMKDRETPQEKMDRRELNKRTTKEERKREENLKLSMLRRQRKQEQRKRLEEGKGHCMEDCAYPSECTVTLRRAIRKSEKQERKKADTKATETRGLHGGSSGDQEEKGSAPQEKLARQTEPAGGGNHQGRGSAEKLKLQKQKMADWYRRNAVPSPEARLADVEVPKTSL